jgi:FtsP/CotA-like multicopper oxidase with cupredoxin domain
MNQMYFHLLLFLLSRLLDTSAAKSDLPTVRETLVITEANFWIDCTTKRKSVLINGTLPGPLLSFQAGSRVIIKVINNMKKHNFTMHWHGLSMAASPWSDGTPNLSQWPIAPGKSFEYEYFLQDDNVGTYFAHSHVGLQLSTAFAPLIIHPRKLCPTAPTFAERILMVSDIWVGI